MPLVKVRFIAKLQPLLDCGQPSANALVIPCFTCIHQTVLAPSDIKAPKCIDNCEQIGIQLPFFRCEATHRAISLPKGCRYFGFEIVAFVIGVIHKPRFKNRLHHSVTKKDVIPGSVVIEDTDLSLLGKKQVAVADIALHAYCGRFLNGARISIYAL